MLRHGLRLRDLGTDRLTWRDLRILLTQQKPSESALWMEQNPDHMWGLGEFLSADIADTLHMLFWAKTKDGAKNRNRPKPIERPGRRPERMGKKPLPLDEMAVWLAERVPVEHVLMHVTKSGKSIRATEAQIAYWTRVPRTASS